MPLSRVNGVNLYWESTGDVGVSLVLVHGSWSDHHGWDAVVPALSKTFKVFTYDRRGHSKSERLTSKGSVREDVDDLAALIEHVAGSRAHVAGSSFGASIALRLAGQRPESFRSLVAHEPPLLGLLADVPEAQPALAEGKKRIDAVAQRLGAGDIAGGTRQFVETIAFGPGAWERLPEAVKETFMFNAPTWLDEIEDPESLTLALPALGAFPHPVLLTQGDQSAPLFPAVLSLLAGALPRARRHTFSGAGHVPHISHPAAYVEVVAAFVRDASG